MPPEDTPRGPEPHAVAEHARALNPVVHERIRFAILCVLSAAGEMPFTELRDLLGLTDGNLNVHARRLEEAACITAVKQVEQRVPRTRFRLTPAGRKALDQHLDQLDALARALRGTT
jgi:DNA-binding MarR family transcriptional regulator